MNLGRSSKYMPRHGADRGGPSSSSKHFLQPDRYVPIQTGALAQIRAADRGSPFRHTGCTTYYPVNGKYVASASVDGRPPSAFAATCEVLSVITQRARMQQRPSSETASVSACDMCGLVLCGSSAGHSIGKTKRRPPSRIIPAESHVAVCMPAARKEAI
jgi:hypothetical protein